ncbi:MAG: hypothetical protein Kow00120_10170 [Anaerolineae bacterium]
MNRQALIFIGLIALALWLLVMCSPEPPAPATAPTATPTLPPWPTDPPTTPGYHETTLQILPARSIVHFSIPFMGAAVTGTLGVKEGTVSLIESEAGSHVIVEMLIDMASIQTGSRALDGILRGILEVEANPTALFVGEALNAVPGLYPRGVTVYVALPAELHIADEVVRKVVDTEALLQGRRMHVVADFTVPLLEAGITPPPLVGDSIAFRVEVLTR